MNFNSSGYFAYKKSKIQSEIEEQKKPISRFSFLLQLFFATFIIIFIIFVIAIMRYSSKMDIEYTKGELQLPTGEIGGVSAYDTPGVVEEEKQGKIDKRLILIQQEENAPYEAKIIDKNTNMPEVMDYSHIVTNKKIEKIEKIEKQKMAIQEHESKSGIHLLGTREEKIKTKIATQDKLPDNITVMSKVLIGRYETFDEAKQLQNEIKAKNPKLQPFVRKVGNVFSVQMGSYQDFAIAKQHAQKLRSKGLDVWIYQQ